MMKGGKTTEQELLYTDWKCFVNSSATFQGSTISLKLNRREFLFLTEATYFQNNNIPTTIMTTTCIPKKFRQINNYYAHFRPFCSFWNCSSDLQVVVMLHERVYCVICTKNAALHAGNAVWCNRRWIQIGSVETQDGDLKLICVVDLPRTPRPALFTPLGKLTWRRRVDVRSYRFSTHNILNQAWLPKS
jgi:hypothetical protein